MNNCATDHLYAHSFMKPSHWGDNRIFPRTQVLLEDKSQRAGFFASAVAVAHKHGIEGYSMDDETDCAPRSVLKNFTLVRPESRTRTIWLPSNRCPLFGCAAGGAVVRVRRRVREGAPRGQPGRGR